MEGGFVEMLNSMCENCNKLGNSCKGTECQTFTGCIYKEKAESDIIDKIKSDVKTYLKDLGYREEQMEFVEDIVSVSRPGVVKVKEKLCGEYTSRFVEMHL